MSHLPFILLVDDNQDDYEAMMRSFRKNHLVNPVHWCRSGAEALDYLCKEGKYANNPDLLAPDIVLLDLNMPGMDGARVLAWMKDDVRFKLIPVIILTTSSDPHDVAECYKLGASTFIQKPVSFDGLTLAMRTMKDYWFSLAVLPSDAVVTDTSTIQ